MENYRTDDKEELIVKEVERDFAQRQQDRASLERKWRLNLAFAGGAQYCDISPSGEIVEEEEGYYWQQRRVFNHIASLMDTRLAKLSRIRPALTVRAASEEESDRHSAALASAILLFVQEEGGLDEVINSATVWSELCGTAFYKIMWNAGGGNVVGYSESGKKLKEGDVRVVAVSPFEIYPYSLAEEDLSSQPSIIHAKALPVEDIYEAYGVKLSGGEVKALKGTYYGGNGVESLDGYELVIERYCRPDDEFPDGRLTVVAGGKLLYDGVLPYVNGDYGERDYPFVRQISVPVAGSFFGTSVVERLIPLQRAYNAVKNRKHEFLNRIAMGCVAVEDGSVDIDELSEEGLVPGKVLVYRQGGTPPEMLVLGSVPDEFWKEEESLLSEFTRVAGSGSLSENADSYSGITSATGLQLIIEQDEQRMNVAYQSVKRALKKIGKQILRLYRQFAGDMRLLKFAGENDVINVFYFKGSDISSDDVVLEADSDLNLTPAQKRTVLYEIMDRGLFSDSNGNTSVSVKNKLLEMLGYSALSGERDLSELNRARAGEENLKMRTAFAEVKVYDDHSVHITEHTAFLLSEELSAEAETRILEHIKEHKKLTDKESVSS